MVHFGMKWGRVYALIYLRAGATDTVDEVERGVCMYNSQERRIQSSSSRD